MSRPNQRSSVLGILGSLGWPIFLGGWTTALLYMLMFKGPLNYPILHRYLAGHPVTYVETGLFIVGLFALIFKANEVLGQFRAANLIQLDPIPPRGQHLEDAPRLIDAIEQFSPRVQRSYLGRRLRDALEHVERSGSAAALDTELKYLSDMDAARQQESYGLVRIVIWATPMLGFLGTVMGITQALGDLDPAALANDVQNAMKGLLAGLYVAFDTTALALVLSMVLMFVQFIIERFESQVLSSVDIRASEEMIGRFEQLGASHDPHVQSIERMSQAVVKAVENVVQRQADLWQETINAAHDRWSRLVGTSTEQVQAALASALQQSLVQHATELGKIEKASSQEARALWKDWQASLTDNAKLLSSQQAEMVRQGDRLVQVVEATGEVMKLEHALNANLSALAGSKNFEDTVMSLSAAIHLLNTRLSSSHETRQIDLVKQGRAA